MKTINFFHPSTKIPMIAEWDEDGKTVMFNYDNFEQARKDFDSKAIEETREWCIQSAINCYSIEQANDHLAHLKIISTFN
ncbi:hypothetical protein [Paenibacillus sp. XY044]|uniref:hypothetical protein n=1 Tax=Paenibacillus sp. XY044 TaxID=2026089 RepID=UPI000B97D697|nr:hypothetical protein [Paenibacillus sp. XY044]OZB98059.1 hypothetical protein CJP46_02515 [Paenibacillus sp. XY044]